MDEQLDQRYSQTTQTPQSIPPGAKTAHYVKPKHTQVLAKDFPYLRDT